MKATFYVNQVHTAIARIKEAHALNVLNTRECNVEWTSRTAVILDIALCDPEITTDDYIIICDAVESGTVHLSTYIFSRTDEP